MPSTLRLNPTVPLVTRSPTSLQVGLNPRRAVVIDGLGREDHLLLRMLSAGLTESKLCSSARTLGLPAERARAMARHLYEAGALRRSAPSADSPGRANCRAIIIGVGRTGLAIAGGLRSGGIGEVCLYDPSPVLPSDIGPGAFSSDQAGLPREHAASALLAPLRNTGRGGIGRQLAVVVCHDVIDPAQYHDLMSRDVPHLAISLGDGHVSVGPLVEPGATCCLRCIGLHRTDRDPGWPGIVAQLSTPTHRQEDAGQALLAAGLGLAAVFAFVDGHQPLLWGATLDVFQPDGSMELRQWPIHARCGCHWSAVVEPDGYTSIAAAEAVHNE